MYFEVKLVAANSQLKPGFSYLGAEVEVVTGAKSAASFWVPVYSG
jgi:hypothetical protein